MIGGGALSLAMLACVAVALHYSLPALAPFIALTSAVLLHLPFSVGFHLFRGISSKEYNKWHTLDLMFICITTVLSAFGLSWHAYSSWQGVLLNTGLTAAVAACVCLELIGMGPHYERPSNHRWQLAALLTAVALFALWPMLFQTGDVLLRGAASGCHACAKLTSATLILLGVGGWVFAASFPEKYFPYTFDYTLFSHPLMHCCHFAAHILQYVFVWQLAKHRAAQPHYPIAAMP